MKYLKSLFFNFLAVFFSNYILPGVEMTVHTKLPHVSCDLLFPIVLGALNTLIYPILRIFTSHVGLSQIAIVALVVNFGAYALLKVLPLGIETTSIEGFLFVGLVISITSFLTNFYEMKNNTPPNPTQPPPLE